MRTGYLLSYTNLRQLPTGIQAMGVYCFVSAVWGAKRGRSIARERGKHYDGFGESDGGAEEPEFSPGRWRVCGALAVFRDMPSDG